MHLLQGDDIQRLDCRAVTLLMGCSSGKLQVSLYLTVKEKHYHIIVVDKPTKCKGSVQLSGSDV